jgi:hypothetical protein
MNSGKAPDARLANPEELGVPMQYAAATKEERNTAAGLLPDSFRPGEQFHPSQEV